MRSAVLSLVLLVLASPARALPVLSGDTHAILFAEPGPHVMLLGVLLALAACMQCRRR